MFDPGGSSFDGGGCGGRRSGAVYRRSHSGRGSSSSIDNRRGNNSRRGGHQGEVVAELAETSGEGGDIADMDIPLIVVGTISGVCTGVGGNDDGRSTWGAADAPPARFAALPGLE